MGRFFLIFLLLGLVAVGIALLGLGAFPPHAPQQQIQKTLPNDRFAHPAPAPG